MVYGRAVRSRACRSLGPLSTLCAALAWGGCGRGVEGEGATASTGARAAAEPGITAAEREGLPGRIVFLAEGEGEAEIVAMRASGAGRATLARAPSSHEGPTIFPGPGSPRGELLAVITVEGEGAAHRERLEIRPIEGERLGAAIWRSEAAPQVRSPAWAPDGRALAFEASFESFRDLYRVDLADGDAAALRRLTDHPAGNYEPAFSPDGAQIAFTSSRDGDAEIYVMPAAGGEARRLTEAALDDFGPVWAPDGRWIAFISSRDGYERLYAVDAAGGPARALTGAAAAVPTGALPPDEAEPAFGPEGRWLAFSARTGPNRAAIRALEVASGRVVTVTAGRASDRAPVWAPGGEHLVFASDRDGDPELYLVSRTGGAATRLTSRPGADWLARWLAR